MKQTLLEFSSAAVHQKMISEITAEIKFTTPDHMLDVKLCYCGHCGFVQDHIPGSRCIYCTQELFVLRESNS